MISTSAPLAQSLIRRTGGVIRSIPNGRQVCSQNQVPTRKRSRYVVRRPSCGLGADRLRLCQLVPGSHSEGRLRSRVPAALPGCSGGVLSPPPAPSLFLFRRRPPPPGGGGPGGFWFSQNPKRGLLCLFFPRGGKGSGPA